MDLAADRDADPQVRAEASEGLGRLAGKLGDAGLHDAAELTHRPAVRDEIVRVLARPAQPRTQSKPPEGPPGPPHRGRRPRSTAPTHTITSHDRNAKPANT